MRERAGRYSFPKGHMEAGETETETAAREIREETGLTVDFIEGFRRVDAFLQRENGRWKEVVCFLACYEGQIPVHQAAEAPVTSDSSTLTACGHCRQLRRKSVSSASLFEGGGR